MGHNMKKTFDTMVKYWQHICWIIGTVVTIASAAWITLAEPRVNTQIHKHTDPINDAIIYQNCLIMVKYNEDEIKAAERMYLSIKRSNEKDDNKQ
jgi:hypothetical protein